MSLLAVEGLRLRYGAVEALHGIDFHAGQRAVHRHNRGVPAQQYVINPQGSIIGIPIRRNVVER